jgi:hypothetical protein
LAGIFGAWLTTGSFIAPAIDCPVPAEAKAVGEFCIVAM